MAAVIQSAILLKPTVVGASRTDLRAGDLITLTAFDIAHTTFEWDLLATPEDVNETPSAAVLSSDTGVGPHTFTVDYAGTYLIRLVVDNGLATEDTQYVALRALTVFGDLTILAAGETQDVVDIPVDIDPAGWAQKQNHNLLKLLSYVQKVSTSGRTLTVDANRGLDSTNPVNDPTIAEGFADFSSVSAAISAALALVPAPSITNPVVITVFPGLYVENVTFAPYVHVVGASANAASELDTSVVIRTTGVSPSHIAAIAGAGTFCFVSGVQLETTANTTLPVLSKTGVGLLYLYRCSLLQNGNVAAQGPSYSHDGGSVLGRECSLVSNATTFDRVALRQDTTATDMLWVSCDFIGASGVDLANSELSAMNAEFRDCRIESTVAAVNAFAVRANSELLVLEHCHLRLSGGLSSLALTVHPSAGAHVSDIVVEVRNCRVEGDINFDTTGVVGDTRLRLGSSEYSLLNLVGVLTEQSALTKGVSLFFDNTLSGISSTNVQEALDHLFSSLVVGFGGFALSLDTAYNGLNPITALPGAGSGRKILADSGAVVIQASDPPLPSPSVGNTNGWLQVEGNVQVGSIGAPEIDLNPNPYGVGPEILGGRLVYPDIDVVHRAIPAFILRANATGFPLYHTFNLLLETHAEANASHGEIGRVLLKGGDSLDGGVGVPPKGGSVYLQGGSGHAALGDPGEVWLSPGWNATLGSTGKVVLTNPTSGLGSSLEAANLFVGGVTGIASFYVSGIGLVTVSIANTDTLAQVQTKLGAVAGLSCVVNPANNPITVYSLAEGLNSEIYFTEDSVAGALNVALGNFSVGSGAACTPGAWTETVSIGCTNTDELTVFGDLVVTGSITSSGAAFVTRKTLVFLDSPYSVLDTDQYLGVDSSGGPIIINLPTTALGAASGRILRIKDEGGVAGANNITIQIALGALIDGAAVLTLNTNFAAVSLVANGAVGAATRWYIQ